MATHRWALSLSACAAVWPVPQNFVHGASDLIVRMRHQRRVARNRCLSMVAGSAAASEVAWVTAVLLSLLLMAYHTRGVYDTHADPIEAVHPIEVRCALHPRAAARRVGGSAHTRGRCVGSMR